MKTSPLGIGIIGCGQISHFHYEGYEKAGARIAHVCDMRLEAAQAVAQRYGARVSTDYRAVLDDPQVQLISVLTPASTHKEICLAAMAAGKGVVCEKTLSDSPANAAAIARAADGQGCFCATAFMKRFFLAAQQAKTLLVDMGPIISIHARSWQPWDLWNGPVPEFLAKHPSSVRRNYGGGALMCCGSHVLDLVQWLGGRPRQVCGQMFVREGMDIDILAGALMWLEQGGVVHFETCWHPLAFAGHEYNGWDERLEITTLKGRLDLYTVTWNKPTNNAARLVHQDARTGRLTEYRYPAINPFDAEMAEMVRLFQTGATAAPSAWDGYVVDEIIGQITESAARNQVLPMRWLDRP